MGMPFDHIASTHDALHMRSPVALLQRKRVWKYIESVLPQLSGFEMLELNCGAAEDPLLFGESGLNIVATDITCETLQITEKTAEHFSIRNKITSHFLDLESLDENPFDKRFDLIISNFGGINSINPDALKSLFQNLPRLLNPGGRFIAVVMPRFCAWETAFFLMRLQFGKAFRRLSWTGSTGEKPAGIWYYRPSQLRLWSKEHFQLVSLRPVGIALPASYLEHFFNLKRHWLLRLNKVEKKLGEISVFSGIADNYVIDLKVV